MQVLRYSDKIMFVCFKNGFFYEKVIQISLVISLVFL